MTDDVPDPHDEQADVWIPQTGPLPWEQPRLTDSVTWWTGGEIVEGIAILDENETDDRWLMSTLHCPDLRRMR